MNKAKEKRFEEYKTRFFNEFSNYVRHSSEFRKKAEKTLSEQKR